MTLTKIEALEWDAFQHGTDDFYRGYNKSQNPYTNKNNARERERWFEGWESAHVENAMDYDYDESD